jgi:GPH family glycoside/pentoside/hexuronide:cation symporter
MYSQFFPPTESDPSGLLNPDSFSPFGLLVSILIATWMVITSIATLSQIPYLTQPTQTLPRVRLSALISQTIGALRNRNFRIVFLACLATAAIAGTGQVFDIYMNLYFWEFSSRDIRWFALAAVGAAAAFVAIGPLQKRFEKQQIITVATILIMVLGMIKVGFRFAGMWPENGDALLLPLLVVHASFLSFAGAIAIIMYASMIPDVVDENEFSTGLRQEGVFSAGIAFAGKSTTGLGLFAGGLLLEWVVAFPVQTQPDTVDPDLIVRLGFVDGILVPAFSIIPIMLLRRYRLSRTQLEAVQKAIKNRKQATENSAPHHEA